MLGRVLFSMQPLKDGGDILIFSRFRSLLSSKPERGKQGVLLPERLVAP